MLIDVYGLHSPLIKLNWSFRMATNNVVVNKNNNNDDNDNDNNRKRKERSYLPADGVQNGPNKRLNVHRPSDTPAAGPPAQPEFGFGNPQIDSPAAYVPQQTTKAPNVAMGSTGVALQYPQSQSPQAQYPQQQPQLAGRSVQHGQKGSGTGMLRHQAIEAYNSISGGIPIEIGATGWPGKGHLITAIPKSETTISMCSGDKGWETIQAQYAYHRNQYGHLGDVQCTMITVPLMSSSRLPDPHQPRQPSTSTENLVSAKNGEKGQTPGKILAQAQAQAQVQTQVQPPSPRPLMSSGLPEPSRGSEASYSTENLISTKVGGRRQKPRKPQAQAQAQPPAPAPAPAQPPAQAHPQDQEPLPCANCNRKDHLVGDCVGPPDQIDGDLPACPICDSFARRVKGRNGRAGHGFDDCHHVKDIFDSHQWDIGHRLAYRKLAALTDDELLMLFRSLVVKRARKVPIRTKLVCWIDVLRETMRRFHNTDVITPMGNMTPWTKAFSIYLMDPFVMQGEPWWSYDYAAGITQLLPADSVESAHRAWEEFVAKGLPGVPAQVFFRSDRN